jgi:hypothetical protein
MRVSSPTSLGPLEGNLARMVGSCGLGFVSAPVFDEDGAYIRLSRAISLCPLFTQYAEGSIAPVLDRLDRATWGRVYRAGSGLAHLG